MSKAAMYISSLTILLAVVATVIFGSSVMSESGHMAMGCFGLASGVNCSMLSPIEHFNAHLRTFQGVSTAVFQISSLLAVLLLFILAVLFLITKSAGEKQANFIAKKRGDYISPQRLEFLEWLALHEKRDPSFSYAMNR